ncbi:hypothetical protein [Halomonas sp. PR-M31]|uniref:hypothetical protein n=1 Tax=Halomonas sp. PR-M31 TaxID=1471202 RepID=UPI0006509D3E|nr:hypothetical protein [Halomonas sp. PR-M31]
MKFPEFNDLQELHEVHDMLAERIKKWPERWEQKGREEVALNLIKMNLLSDAQIAEAAKLSEAEVKALRDEAQDAQG